MAIQNEPTRIQIPFADSGTKNVIPDTNSKPSASQAASWTDGFPSQCSLPLSAGGIPPARADFNGIFNTITQSERFTQEGGIWAWDATVDYAANRLVLGSDGMLYWSIAQSGPNLGGAQNPTTDIFGVYWYSIGFIYRSNDYVGLRLSQKMFSKGVTAISNPIFGNFEVFDSNGSEPQNRLGTFETRIDPDGLVTTHIEAYRNEALSDEAAQIIVGCEQDGTKWSTAPSTLLGRNNGNDILTRDWIPQDARVVHTSGNENIDGIKTFNKHIRLNGGNDSNTISLNSVNNSMYFISGPELGKNANLQLHGYDFADATKGYFFLQANTNTLSKTLNGTPSGSLTWNGQPLQIASDERLKTALSDVPDNVLDAWGDVRWGQFQFLEAIDAKGDAARLHLGLIAQRVKTVFEDRGLDACAYGILCHEEREATEHSPAIDLWMVRYDEAQAMEAVYQRRRADRAEARLAALEERLAAIEAKLNA